MSRRRQPPDDGGTLQFPAWLAGASGLLGMVFGTATNLYSAEFRSAVEAPFRSGAVVSPVLVAAAVASASTAAFYWWLIRRRQHTVIANGEIELRAEILESMENNDDSVVGRSIQYVEAKRSSDDLLIFLHGLGLDANDFRPYLAESRFHCIALTMYGFRSDERQDHYAPISLQAHVEVLAYALREVRRMYPRKRISLIGFSFGADMIFFLTKYAPDVLESIDVHRAVLLDPNASNATTTISSKVATVTEGRPLSDLVSILSSATTVTEFRYLCEYLYKITAKDFAQVQRHARDVVAVWNSDSLEPFLDYVGQLTRLVSGVHVVFSFNYEPLFNPIAHRAKARGLDTSGLECSRSDHFELIGPAFLKQRLEGLVSGT